MMMVIDPADPTCERCKGKGDETPLHLLAECESLATLRLQIFGREDLVPPGAVPDFSDLPLYKIIAFFREAKFTTLSMLPFRDQYLPTNTINEDSNKSLRDRKAKADDKGKEWTSKYLFHIPLQQVLRRKLDTDDNSSNGDTIEVAQPSEAEDNGEELSPVTQSSNMGP